jgi:predicted dehydrogenase
MISAPVRSVAALGVGVFGPHEDIAEARIEFEDGCVAHLTASRVSYQAARKMQLWGSEGYVALDFAARHGTVVRPTEVLRRGELDISGLDLANPAAIKDYVFGKVLRVDQVQAEGRDSLALELEEFVQSVLKGTRPKVSGADALRSLQLAEQVLECVRSHQWEGIPSGLPVIALQQPASEPSPAIRGPLSWRLRAPRPGSSTPSHQS